MTRKKLPSRTQFKDDSGLTTHVLDLLSPWRPVEIRRMFSGTGLFASGKMFAIIIDDILYLKDNTEDEVSFEKEYFEYDRQGKTVRLGYFKVPERALDDSDYLIQLADSSHRAASVPKKLRKRKLSPREIQELESMEPFG